MDIITTSSTKEIIIQNKCQMWFLYKLILKQGIDKKLTINVITCSMLESPSTSNDDDMENDVYKSTPLEPTIKHLMKETGLCHREAHNLVSREQNIRA